MGTWIQDTQQGTRVTWHINIYCLQRPKVKIPGTLDKEMVDLESWSCRGVKLIVQCMHISVCRMGKVKSQRNKWKIKCFLKLVIENSSAQFLQVSLWQKGLKWKRRILYKCIFLRYAVLIARWKTILGNVNIFIQTIQHENTHWHQSN